MIILNLLTEKEKKPRRFFKKTKKPSEPPTSSEPLFINRLPHYIINGSEASFCGELLPFLKKHKGKILLPEPLINNETLKPLMFDTSSYEKLCAFSSLKRYLKCADSTKKALHICDNDGVLQNKLLSVMPFVKTLCVYSDSGVYGQAFSEGAYSNYGVKVSVKPYKEKKVKHTFASFDELSEDGSLYVFENGAKKELKPSLIKKNTEGFEKLRALGISEKYIYAAF